MRIERGSRALGIGALVVVLSVSGHADDARGAATVPAKVAQPSLEAEAITVLDAFMATFNARDPEAHTATYHFPHFRLARGAMSFWETREVAVRDYREVFRRLQESGWHHSRWVERDIVTAGTDKIHVATRFQRLRVDGSVIGTYDSLYVLIRRDGRWGVKLRSSFLP